VVYVIGLVTMLTFSAAYNMWPVSPAKWVPRRFDHCAIYLLNTPFMMQMKNVLVQHRCLVERRLDAGNRAVIHAGRYTAGHHLTD